MMQLKDFAKILVNSRNIYPTGKNLKINTGMFVAYSSKWNICKGRWWKRSRREWNSLKRTWWKWNESDSTMQYLINSWVYSNFKYFFHFLVCFFYLILFSEMWEGFQCEWFRKYTQIHDDLRLLGHNPLQVWFYSTSESWELFSFLGITSVLDK